MVRQVSGKQGLILSQGSGSSLEVAGASILSSDRPRKPSGKAKRGGGMMVRLPTSKARRGSQRDKAGLTALSKAMRSARYEVNG